MEGNLEKAYGNGLYHKLVFILAMLFPLVGGYVFQTTIFDGYIPKFTCNLDQKMNDNITWYKDPISSGPSTDQCYYSLNNGTTRIKCTSFTYQSDVMLSNYVTQFDLICDREYLLKWLDSIYFIFQTFTWLWALLSDIIGRRTVITGLVCGQISMSILILFANNIIVLFICRAVLGVCSMLTYFGFFYIMEVLPESKRFWSNSYWISWSFGYILTTLVAYLGRTSFWIHCMAILPISIYIPLLLLMKESPAWLMTRNRFSDSAEIIMKIAKINSTEKILDKPIIEAEIIAEKKAKDEMNVSETLVSYCCKLDLFLTSALLAVTYCFLVSGYYVISNSTTFLFENLFLNTLVQGILEIPTSITSALICRKFKRRMTNLLIILFVSVCILINGLSSSYVNVRIIFGILGKFALANALCTVSYVVGEVTPISLHGSGFFSVVTLAHLISAFSSFIYRTNLPVYIVYSIFAGTLTVLSIMNFYLIPETKDIGSVLTISDAKKLKRSTDCSY